MLRHFNGGIRLEDVRNMTIDQYYDLTKMIERNMLMELSGADPSNPAAQLAKAMNKGLI